ncbi:MAG TPA: MBL fold metallo-hydrolase [Candidatus Saccharimonadales bacterium]|jgi:L-ascorbate metabolism protein UlaG (beta-lactamase superfamily)
MQVTKYAHACFVAETDGKALIVDPGTWSDDLQPYDNVVGIVVTHAHPDHLDSNMLLAITTHNPDVVIYGPEDVISQLNNLPGHAVTAGDTMTCGPFGLEFFGGGHADIHSSMPSGMNVGVMINNDVYYPGDSFTVPGKPVAHLALPVSAPWLKLSEVIDFVQAVKPTTAFPTHDAILSDTGKALVDQLLSGACKNSGVTYERLPSATS